MINVSFNKLNLMTISWKTKRKGYWLFKQGKVKKELETDKRIHFLINSDEKHSVILDKIKNTYSCDCNFYSLKFKDCSHIIACKLFQGEMNAG